MKIIFKSIFLAPCLIGLIAYSQNVTIDYQAWNPSSPPCNIFAAGVNVPATIGGSSSIIFHGSTYGQPQYNTSVTTVELPVNYVDPSDTRGTQYRIAYNFKQGYSYQIVINAAEKTSTQGTGNNLYLRLSYGFKKYHSRCAQCLHHNTLLFHYGLFQLAAG